MHEIICPHCNKAFKIDEAGYADILKQVRDGAFEQQLHERPELAEQDKRNAVELVQAKAASEMQKSAVAKDSGRFGVRSCNHAFPKMQATFKFMSGMTKRHSMKNPKSPSPLARLC